MSYASLKRRVIALGFIFVDCCGKLLANEESIFLDFHCREQQNGPETVWNNLGMKKSSIGGKQYLDNL